MKNLLLLLLLGLIGCQSSVKTQNLTDGMTAQEIIEKDVFISLTPDDIGAKISTGTPYVLIPEARAATYRFYKQVSFDENHIATCKVNNGSEIKISEELFKNYMKDLEATNETARNALATGQKINFSNLDDEYFDRLLDENYWQETIAFLQQQEKNGTESEN